MPPPGGQATGHIRHPQKDHLRALAARRHRALVQSLAAMATPPSFDSRSQGWVGPIKDQGQCGSCHDDKTEVLTEKEGWVLWSDYDWKDRIATMNLASESLEFQSPTRKHIYNHDGPMYYSEHNRLSFALTPEHGMYVIPRKRKDKYYLPFLKRTTIKSMPRYCELPTSTKRWLGLEVDKLSIGDRWTFNGDDFIALLALVISDGCVYRNPDKNLVTYCCFREDRIDKIRKLSYRLGIKEQKSRSGVWNIYDKSLTTWFLQNCYDKGGHTASFKRVPLLIKTLSQRQIEIFLDYFGDVHIQGPSRRFYTCSKGLADDIQELLLRTGKRSSIVESPPRNNIMKNGTTINGNYPEFIINENLRGVIVDSKDNLKIDHYKGLVYCATVPNGTIVTRRDKRLLISSNCWCFSGTGVTEIAYYKAGALKPDGSDALSEQYTLDCGRNGGCNGDDNVTVLEWAKQTGIPKTADYGQYEARSTHCHFQNAWTLYKVNDWGFADGGQGQGVTASNLIKAAIMQYGCVGCGVDAGFSDPGTGVISGGGNNIDHDVILVGWDDSKGAGGAWILRNSWGTSWANQGYAWIEYGAYAIGTEAVWAEVQAVNPPIDWYV